MQWNSPWGYGFPGWHIECSAMSQKYLGNYFDIHGGGMDLQFPHHESEMAQSKANCGSGPAKYWLHNNMITINGQKMGKSLGNFITLQELFNGSHNLLEKSYTPMTIRFFILQAQYRSTLDFSNEALQAAGKGFRKLLNAFKIVKKLSQSGEKKDINTKLSAEIEEGIAKCYAGMNDDFNTGITIAAMFALAKPINMFFNKQADIDTIDHSLFEKLKQTYISFFEDVLGLKEEASAEFIQFADEFLNIYIQAKQEKQYDKVDAIRVIFKSRGLVIKDMKHGIAWGYEE
jgi:cysteinyl-tRNA synthetase